jgi:hypothetical protein
MNLEVLHSPRRAIGSSGLISPGSSKPKRWASDHVVPLPVFLRRFDFHSFSVRPPHRTFDNPCSGQPVLNRRHWTVEKRKRLLARDSVP